MGDISREIEEKGLQLFKEGKAIKEVETDKRIHFRVMGETENHSVIFDKERNKWKCDCSWNTLKKKECSHILACQNLNSKI